MKTTLDLPDPLMRRVKILAASEGRKLKEIIADLLEKGMDSHLPEEPRNAEPPYHRDPTSRLLVSRRIGSPGSKKVSVAESLAAIEQANEEEALSHAGNSR